jgi:hypothetical protein
MTSSVVVAFVGVSTGAGFKSESLSRDDFKVVSSIC